MDIFAKSLLSVRKKEEPEVVVDWIVDVLTVRGNRFTIDNENKTVTVYKKVASSGTIYNMDILPVAMDGYEVARPDTFSGYTNGGVTYWRHASTGRDGTFVEYDFNIINSTTGDVVATYTIILDWTTE